MANAATQADDRADSAYNERFAAWGEAVGLAAKYFGEDPVSYTHLTLPTICSV